jgi:hypothetical protein
VHSNSPNPSLTNESENKIATARESVLAWVSRDGRGDYSTSEELVRAFCSRLPPDMDLDLRTTRNPSAMVYEARWYHRGREVDDFPKPFCAEIDEDARILACAAMINLPG